MTRRIERAMALLRGGHVGDGCLHRRRRDLAGLVQLDVHRDRRRDPELVPLPPARRGGGDAAVRREDAHPPGPVRLTLASPPTEQDRRSTPRGGCPSVASMTNIALALLPHHRRRRRRRHPVLPRRARPRGRQRRRLRRPPLGELRLPRPARPRGRRSPSPARGPLARRRRRAAPPRREGLAARTLRLHDQTTSTPRSSACAPSAPRCCRSRSTRRWGPRDCAFRDPAGNHIRINQA